MRREIVYLMSGPAHMPYLVASLWTLRNHWNGELTVHAWPESFDIAKRVAADKRLAVSAVRKREPAYRGKNGQFLDKMRVAQSSEADVVLYLDADTTIHGGFNVLFDAAKRFGFAATQFCDWFSNGRMISGRINCLREFPEIDQLLVVRAITRAWPSVNGGVWAARPESPVLRLWYEWTTVAKTTFIADEKVLHLMMLKFCPEEEMTVVCGNGRYNCSPMHQSKRLPDGDVVVRHYHGDCNVRPRKSAVAHNLWWPVYQECLRKNAGNIAEWNDAAVRRNKHMRRLKK